jgi:hypothetical protein
LIGCMENNASPIDLCRLTHLHRRVNDHSEKPPSVGNRNWGSE